MKACFVLLLWTLSLVSCDADRKAPENSTQSQPAVCTTRSDPLVLDCATLLVPLIQACGTESEQAADIVLWTFHGNAPPDVKLHRVEVRLKHLPACVGPALTYARCLLAENEPASNHICPSGATLGIVNGAAACLTEHDDPAECCDAGQIFNPTTGLCELPCTDPTPYYNPNSRQCEACPAHLPFYNPTLRVCEAACPGGTAAGGNAPFTGSFELGRNSGTFAFTYQTFTVRDQVIVKYEGAEIFNSGCVGEDRTVDLPYSGSATNVIVQVVPNCLGTSGTAWEFQVACPTLGRPAPNCSSRYANKTINGQSCTSIISRANQLSERVRDGSGRFRAEPHFTREEISVVYDAVECRTSVPAWTLRAHSFQEAVGKYYHDPYPRQAVEPCEVWHRPCTGGPPDCIEWLEHEPVSRYYGRNWPLLALDASTDTMIALAREADNLPPGIDGGNDFRCANSEPPIPGGSWAAVWDKVSHAIIGDDRSTASRRNSFGLGLTQVTFYIKDEPLTTTRNGGLLRQGRRISLINDTRYIRSTRDLFPIGGELANPSDIPTEPQQNRIDEILHDPQYNVLIAAQLVADKWQQRTNPPDGANAECNDSRYGRILIFDEAGWSSLSPEEIRNNYMATAGDLGRGFDFFKQTWEFNLATSHARCFCFESDPAYRVNHQSDCELAYRHAFAFGCTNFTAYCAGIDSIPADDPCHPDAR